MTNTFVDKVLLVFLSVLVGFMVCMIACTPFVAAASNQCLSLGYPKAYITFPYEVSCGKRVLGTDIIKKLDDIKNER